VDGGKGVDSAFEPFETALRLIESQLTLVVGRPERVREACKTLTDLLGGETDPGRIRQCHARLASLLRLRQGPVAEALFSFLEVQFLSTKDPRVLVLGILGARDSGLQRRGLALACRAFEDGRVAVDLELARALARAVDGDEEAEKDVNLLGRIGDLLRSLPTGHLRSGPQMAKPKLAEPKLAKPPMPGPPPAEESPGDDPLETLLVFGSPASLRRLAARVLDGASGPLPADRVARLLGAEAAEILVPLLEYARATHQDLVDLTPGRVLSQSLADSLSKAAQCLGRPLLGAVIGELGFARIAWGISLERLIGLSVEGGFPVVVRPSEAAILESCRPSRRLWDRFLLIAHGGSSTEEEAGGDDSASVQRFRRYNVLHAELLGEILEIAPLTGARVGRILSRLDGVVELFTALFADQAEDASRVEEVYLRLKSHLLGLTRGLPDEQSLPADVTRLVMMFEDPRTLDEVRTLHGLKRYLHQQGLRLAFRVFRSGRATNRTVTLVLTSATRVLQVVRKIRYIDFEVETEAEAGEIPFAAALMTEALGRKLLQGTPEMPEVELLIYGNEVQAFVSFRNHPVFVRLDLSPPLRGGMIDLEYFGVSQYELDQHPDLSLQWIQRVFRKLEIDVQLDGFRLHARYDKERAFEFDDLLRHVRLLCYLMPHLMELDWVIASLEYTEQARAAVADAWADFLLAWGVLPIPELLTQDRRRVLAAVEADPAGAREVPWDGRGDYHDRFSSGPAAGVWDGLWQHLRARGLDHLLRIEQGSGPCLAQLPLEASVLEPLREAVAQGRIKETSAGFEPAAESETETSHETERLARLLAGNESLIQAAWLGTLVGSVERHLRFITIGHIQGYQVQRASLPLRGERVELAVLRDGNGIARLGLATERPFHLWPGPRTRTLYKNGTNLDCTELIRRLRRDNYVTAGYDPPPGEGERGADLVTLFTESNPLAPPAVSPGDRVVQGMAASPGKSAGFARFGMDGRAAEDFDGTVVFAPAVRPEDTPVIRRCAAIVSTGGGILSHAGVIALELHKPALIIPGRWGREADGRASLTCRYQDFREEEREISGFRVVRRRDLRERDEVLREGDLVVVDADAGTLTVLGQDRDALALQQELLQLDGAVARLSLAASDGSETLLLRGRMLRAVHQLERLLGRIDRAALARYATRQLLLSRPVPHGTAGHDGRVGILHRLFLNPACGADAIEAARRQESELSRRHRALGGEARSALGSAMNLFEVLHLRLGVLQVGRMLSGVRELLSTVGMFAAGQEELPQVDHLARTRLTELRDELRYDAASKASNVQAGWKLHHLLKRMGCLDRVLGVSDPDEAMDRIREVAAGLQQEAMCRQSSRRVLTGQDGGIELAPLIGSKGANLGEIARILGPEFVPSWFAVTDFAFREVLAGPPGNGAPGVGIDPSVCRNLEHAIERTLVRRDSSPARKAAAIRHLWHGVELPSELIVEMSAAYRALGQEQRGQGDAGFDHDPAEPYVAIRSSGFEEDMQETSWAGQFDTFLFIRGEDSLHHYLKMAMASLWTERAIAYREVVGSNVNHRGGGVLVQQIVHSRAAGVLHTLSAGAGRLREMVINVGLGLGEGVVSGTVEVDHIVVSRETDLPEDPLRFRYLVGDKTKQVVFDRRAGLGTRLEETLYHQRLRPALEYSDLCEVVRTAAVLDSVYGYPLDIEFALAGDRLSILQVRPIVAFQSSLRETCEHYPLAAVHPAGPNR
jgi:phosphohistidine swiveling domain-containing protein